ncbi:hypothetical protein F3Y22_tig00111502pilonHSYRG00012 [Hibiscus syriacus]|uniref:Uncharacterized protein n=1 Tax=Hibiscus syriacus TaxID=106335 RepID=A0A6A2YI36_HIBSY|nr:hypothetical protein F3Y22_tig00111502pilonHSYRG00012 [Hibiscus syriacus]
MGTVNCTVLGTARYGADVGYCAAAWTKIGYYRWNQSVVAHRDAIKPFLKEPRNRRKHDVSVMEKVSKGDSSKEKEDKMVEAGDSVLEVDVEDRLTIRELLTFAKHDSENMVTSGASESPLGPQRQPCSIKEVEALAEMKTNTKRCAADTESSDETKRYKTLNNICKRLSVGECQNMPMIMTVTDKEDVEKTECEPKQDAKITKNANSIGESKGLVTDDDVKSKPGLKDGQGLDTTDLFTLSLELETRICRLEKRFAKLKN